jgi:hypothetical protein
MVVPLDACQMYFFHGWKAMEMAWPGRGDAADASVRAAGGDDIKLMQQAYYNEHYGFAGAKVQHVLQAEGMRYSFTCPLLHHDAIVLQESVLLTMLSVLYINNNPLRPIKCVSYKAWINTASSAFTHKP